MTNSLVSTQFAVLLLKRPNVFSDADAMAKKTTLDRLEVVAAVHKPLKCSEPNLPKRILNALQAELLDRLNFHNCIYSNGISPHMDPRCASYSDAHGRRNGGALRGHCHSCPLKGGATGAQVSLHTSIISNFMIYQDQLEAHLLQLFAHT